jgi:hypothetical protein
MRSPPGHVHVPRTTASDPTDAVVPQHPQHRQHPQRPHERAPGDRWPGHRPPPVRERAATGVPPVGVRPFDGVPARGGRHRLLACDGRSSTALPARAARGAR